MSTMAVVIVGNAYRIDTAALLVIHVVVQSLSKKEQIDMDDLVSINKHIS